MKKTIEYLEEKLSTYKQLKHLVDLYDERPEDWTIQLFHWHNCMLGRLNNYSSINLSNDEVVLQIVNSLRKDLKAIEKELNL